MSGPTLRQALPVWTRIGLLSFGGPAGQIALMQDEVVTRRGWVPADSFDRGLAFSMMLPGPEAQQLATWLGWRLHGLRGGLIAGMAFILPGMALMIGLAWIAAAHGEVPLVAAIFAAVQPVVIALVLAALKKIAGRALGGPLHWALAAAAFAALYIFSVPFPLVVAAAALAGLALQRTDDGAAPPSGPPVLHHAVVTLGITAVLIGADIPGVTPAAGSIAVATSPTIGVPPSRTSLPVRRARRWRDRCRGARENSGPVG